MSQAGKRIPSSNDILYAASTGGWRRGSHGKMEANMETKMETKMKTEKVFQAEGWEEREGGGGEGNMLRRAPKGPFSFT